MKKVLISGHFNPLHIGHLKMIEEAKTLGDTLIVVVCNDFQARMKRPKVFIPQEERAFILSKIKEVDQVVIAEDTTSHIAKTLEKIKPDVFANGCDENHPDLIEEKKVCDLYGIKIATNVGGQKIRSSSEILKEYYE